MSEPIVPSPLPFGFKGERPRPMPSYGSSSSSGHRTRPRRRTCPTGCSCSSRATETSRGASRSRPPHSCTSAGSGRGSASTRPARSSRASPETRRGRRKCRAGPRHSGSRVERPKRSGRFEEAFVDDPFDPNGQVSARLNEQERRSIDADSTRFGNGLSLSAYFWSDDCWTPVISTARLGAGSGRPPALVFPTWKRFGQLPRRFLSATRLSGCVDLLAIAVLENLESFP